MNRRLFVSGALASWPMMSPAMDTAEQDLVLVASARSPLAAIAAPDVRKLYLGLPVIQGGREVVPLINNSSQLIKEIFLQKVLFMSAQIFERQMVSRVFRQGGSRIAEYNDLRSLSAALVSDPQSVSFMLAASVDKQAGIKVLSELWARKN